jgi:hypothetical protein
MPVNTLKKLVKNKVITVFLDSDLSAEKELELIKDKLKPTYYTFAVDGKLLKSFSSLR